jgi:hypothetical protein
MAWETRRRSRYFYRSKRVGTHVRKVYLGGGQIAQQAAEKDAAAKAKQAAQKVELAELQVKLSSVDQLAAEVETGVGLLLEGSLLAMGFHEHKGQWWRRRDVD